VSGQAAQDFRVALIDKYDVASGQDPPNGILEYAEVGNYAHDLEYYLEHNDLMYQGAKLRKFQLLNQDIKTDTKGLIDATASDTGEIEIKFYFDAHVPTGNQDISLSDPTINDAIYAPLNETFHGTYKIEHTEYMVNIAGYSNIKMNKGSFFLIRTPFGEIYHYSVTYKAGKETGDSLVYEEFSWIECPLILFIVVAIFGYFIVTMPERFRRHDVLKIGLLHTIAKILLLLLLILYFFAGFGGFFVSGVYLWIMCIAFMFVTLVLSKTMYENAERIRPKPKEEPAEGEEEEKPEEKEPRVAKREVQCSNCAEIYQLPEYDTVASALCPACGKMGATALAKDGELILSGESLPEELPPREPIEPSEAPPEEPPAEAPPEPSEPKEEPSEAPPSEPKEEASETPKRPPRPKKKAPRAPKKSVKKESEES
jgi:hypothetical protein